MEGKKKIVLGLKGLEEEGCALGEFDQGTLATKQHRSSNEVWKVCSLGIWAKVYSTRQENCQTDALPAVSSTLKHPYGLPRFS